MDTAPKKKIVVAEDDQFLSNAYRVKLTKEGFEVKMVGDGQELMNLLKTYRPDIIILDLLMPVKDGFEAIKEIKASPSLKNIPVIIASNLGQKNDIDQGKALGASDYIIKSDLSLEDLVAKIKSLLGTKLNSVKSISP
ncbi:hypothetical protein A3A60_02015 [Candidatus Curtissbacteria bacterium RIFCSPLOWO2_01_FULL_42_26]|uniref:Response regulatory domain-containing protein n=1 Tax=Candidatus Curtissbacteria bacterium RIFCSPLOWO2_01_FULL_42_26 TaxID=1797729 RepID=A0A1F5I4Q5_9BACT|nr:MAG: hypothetical protein A3A60_02015 [Candidatus Curtissbacteria bacterium RIFCSPLOWO2_01_FULL_42_26]